jgi:hypothetical protein
MTQDSSSEHYLRAGSGTQTACSCGKTFGLSSDANQHIQWQLNLAQDRKRLLERVEGELPEKEGLAKRGIPLGQWAGFNQALSEVKKILEDMKNAT